MDKNAFAMWVVAGGFFLSLIVLAGLMIATAINPATGAQIPPSIVAIFAGVATGAFAALLALINPGTTKPGV